MLEHLIGSAASVIAFALFLPQARATWRNRHNAAALRAVSLGTQWLVVTNALLWFAYGAVTQAFWIAAPGFVNLPLAMVSITLISRARRTAVTAQQEALRRPQAVNDAKGLNQRRDDDLQR